ncbi:MAG: SdpI family protein [Spirochaetia bacterium]|nr:SdpI family protein [Spirochaetia bacterium]
MKRTYFLAVTGFLTAICLGLTAWAYRDLPALIPLHWNIRGEMDGKGPRQLLWIFSLLPMALSTLMAFFPGFDLKKKGAEKHGRALLITMGLVSAVLFAVFGFAFSAALGLNIGNLFFVIPLIPGLGLVVLGNFVPQIRQNKMFGIRTPWTLADDEVWRKTHRFGAYVLVASGFLLAGTAFFLKVTAGVVVFASVVPLAMVLVTAYSFWEYRRRFPKP